MTAELAVIVLNYRTYDLTVACLASLEGEVEPGVRVVVVDNASADGSADRIERAIADRGWSAWAAVVRAPSNGGFAAGNNVGLRAVDATAYVLLNSDTIVQPGALRALREALHAHPDAGVIGSGILTPEGGLAYSSFRFAAPVSELIRAANTGPITHALRRFDPILPLEDAPRDADWVSFAAVLIRRATIDAVGLLDDGYFMYFEDVDYCRRARAAGWKVLYWPRAKIVHLEGGSSSMSDRQRKRAPRYYYEARARYFAKWYGRSGLWAANLLWCLGRAVSLAREAAGRAPNHRVHEAVDIWINAGDPVRPRPGVSP